MARTALARRGSCWPSGRFCSLAAGSRASAASVSTGGAAEARKGGTLRLSRHLRFRLRRSGARVRLRIHGRSALPPARSSSTIRTSRVRRGRDWSRRSFETFSVSPRRSRVHVRSEAHLPLPHGRAGDGAQLRRRVQPGREPAAASHRRRTSCARSSAPSPSSQGKAAGDLRSPRAGPLPAADPADQAGRRLHRAADDCPSSARSCRTPRSTRRGSTTRPAQARTTWPSESRTGGSC